MSAWTPTPQQQAVVDAREGTVLVLAAVGSGKTTTLSHRIAAHLADGVDPERVLALTFTNRAAEHLRAGVSAAVGEARAKRAVLSTFHALCNRILRAHSEAAGLPSGFRILDEEDAEELLRELGVDRPRGAMYALGADASKVRPGEPTVELWTSGAFSPRDEARPYVEALLQRGAIDFGGLVLLTRALLLNDPACRADWAGRFDTVLVDEVQDTHLSEYEVLATLARGARSFCLVGDLDQTIYGWRGSAPKRLLAALDRDFGPVQRLDLTTNFRSTPALLAVANQIAAGLSNRESQVEAPADRPAGQRPSLRSWPDEEAELDGVAAACARRLAGGADPRRMAVLVRTNAAVQAVSQAMSRAGVPCATAEQFRFYRRAEIKDALALARLVTDRTDEQAARRVARRLVKGVGARTVARVLEDLQLAGLRIHDLLDTPSVERADPLWGLSDPDVVVLDTETTGVDPSVDEVIEVGAQRIRRGHIGGGAHDQIDRLLRNTRPLGSSEAVHQISQARLDADGADPRDVLQDLWHFIGTSPVGGHNVAFDVAMLEAMGRRHGVPLKLRVAWDSLDAARRLLTVPRYTLSHLVAHLDIPQQPTHRALDDVLATVAVADRLRRLAQGRAAERRAAMERHAPVFERLRRTLDRWAEAALRPPALIRRITQDALRFKYPGEPRRLDHLAELADRLEALDDPALPPAAALTHVLARSALVRDVDQLDHSDGVRVVTMHQSKGLEFDAVWLPGLLEGALPSWQALRDGSAEALDEERRVLYVAATRAREALHLSWPERGRRGRAEVPSRFLEDLGDLVAREDG